MIEVFVDGSCPQPYGVGGWACVVRLPEEPAFDSGYLEIATNQTMELMAALGALRLIKRLSLRDSPLTIFSDSQYVIRGMMEWGTRWQETDYEGIANDDFWRLLHGHQAKCSNLRFQWIKGHAGNQWNEYVDKMAGRAQRKGLKVFAEPRVKERA